MLQHELLRDMIERLPSIIFVKDLDGKYLLTNRRFYEDLDILPPAAIGRSDFELFPPEVANAYRASDAQALEAGGVIEVELPRVGNGNSRTYRTLKFPLYNASQVPYAICGVSTDVTERRRVEEEQRELLTRARTQHAFLLQFATLEAVAEGNVEAAARYMTEQLTALVNVERASVWLFEDESQQRLRCIDSFTRTNQMHDAGEVLEWTGMPHFSREIHGTRCLFTTDAVNDPRTAELAATYLRTYRIVSIVLAPVRAAGTVTGLVSLEHIETKRHWTADEIGFASETADQLAQVVLNRSRRQREDDVRRIEKLYRRAITAADAVPYLQDYAKDTYEFMGENIEKLIGYPYAEVTPALIERITEQTIMRGESEGYDSQVAFEMARAGKIDVWQCDVKIRTKQGDIRWFSDAAVEIRGSSGKPTGSIGMLIDITGRKRIEEEQERRFERQSRQQGVLLRTATHDALARGDVAALARAVIEDACDAIEVERASVWLVDPSDSRYLQEVVAYERSTRHLDGGRRIDWSLCTVYMHEIMTGRTLNVTEAQRDGRVSELRQCGVLLETVASTLEATIRSGGKVVGVLRFEHAGESRAWRNDEISFAAEISDQLAHAYSNARRREDEESVRRIEQLYRHAIEAAGAVPYYQIYAQPEYGYIGDQIEALTGYSSREFNLKILDRITVDYVTRGHARGIPLDTAVDMARTGKIDIWQCDYKIVAKNGEIRWISDAAVEQLNEEGVSTGSIGLFSDITDRKRTEEDLRYQIEMLQLITDISTRFVNVSLDQMDMEINRALRAICEFAGADRSCYFLWSATERSMSKTHEWCTPGTSSYFDEMQNVPACAMPWLASRIEGGLNTVVNRLAELTSEATAERDLFRNQGARSAVCVPVSFGGKTVSFVALHAVHQERDWRDGLVSLLRIAGEIIFNAIARKRAEEERSQLEHQIRHSQKLESLGILAGGIAHDFNNLLVAMLGNADLALQDLPAQSPIRDYVVDIETAARRAADLCRQMLAYSGKGRFVVEAVDLREIVHEMATMLEVSISKKARIQYDFPQSLPRIHADATQIRQVVMNLITNASEALGDSPGLIAVTLASDHCDSDYLKQLRITEELQEGHYVYLEVSDTGCGMDDATISRMFDPFFTTKFTGRGLGMAAVLGIVRGHRGAIKVMSEVGVGSTIRVYFPAAQASDPEKDAPPHTPRPMELPSGTVLFVDDEDVVRHTGEKMLDRLGFGVLLARDGAEAMEIYRAHREKIVCCIVDLTMPNMDGEETLTALRKLDSSVRVIFSSGYKEQHHEESFSGKGLSGFIEKPYTIKKLETKLREVLAH